MSIAGYKVFNLFTIIHSGREILFTFLSHSFNIIYCASVTYWKKGESTVTVKALLQGKIVLLDGGMGTMLQTYGMEPGEGTENLNFRLPEAVCAVQRAYHEAGSDILFANTFGINAKNMIRTGHTVEEAVQAAIHIAKQASDGGLVGLDVGPIGEMLEPYGDLTAEEAYHMFAVLCAAGQKYGADLIAIETIADVQELRLAVRAAKTCTDLPVFATMTFRKEGRTFMGGTPEELIQVAEEMRIDAVGLNCSLEPKDIYPIAEKMVALTSLPVIAKPNAGLPGTGGYNVDAANFVKQMERLVSAGVKIIGGCCGTRPEYIQEMYKRFK